jgi:hypothetical protein
MAAMFSIGNSVVFRGTTSPVMQVISIDNALGRVTTGNAGVIATYDQESLQVFGVNPPISISAPTGLRVATDPPTKAGVF